MLWKISFLALFTVTIEVLAYEKKMSEKQKEKFKESLKKYCKDNGAEDRADEALTAIKESVKCIGRIVNLNVVKEEISKAKADGTMNIVMAKYCEQATDLKLCIRTMTTIMADCMTETVRAHIKGYNNAIDGFIDFACHKENGQLNIASFVAEGGLDCINDKKSAIKKCSDKMTNNVFWEHCSDFDAYSACQVEVFKSCPNPVPGKLVEQLLEATRAKSPCDKNYKKPPRTAKTNPPRTTKKIQKPTSADLQKPDSTTTLPQEATLPQKTTRSQETTPPHITNAFEEITTDDDLTLLRAKPPSDEDIMAKYTMSEKQRKRFRQGMKIYCLQNGGDVRDADEMEVALKNLIKCITGVMEPKKVKKQMEMAMPFGKKMVKKVFGKYCERSNQMENCIFDMTKKAVNCMTENTRYLMDSYNGVVSSVLDFWCYDGAERLGRFFTQGGPECVENTYEKLVECGLEFNNGTVFWENCDTFKEWTLCLVNELEACSQKSISKLAKRMFGQIYKPLCWHKT